MAPKTPVSTPSACKKKRWENKNKTTVEKQRQARPKIKSTLSAGNETAESKLLSKLKTCRRYEGAVGRAPTSDDWGAATVAPQRAKCRKARLPGGISPIAPPCRAGATGGGIYGLPRLYTIPIRREPADRPADTRMPGPRSASPCTWRAFAQSATACRISSKSPNTQRRYVGESHLMCRMAGA